VTYGPVVTVQEHPDQSLPPGLFFNDERAAAGDPPQPILRVCIDLVLMAATERARGV
jgi:hypothetical protein